MTEDKPLRQFIEDTPSGNTIFRTDFPQYNAEFVGKVLSRLVTDGVVVKLAAGRKASLGPKRCA